MQEPDAAEWIKKLKLEPHPEGGWYRETYRSAETIAGEALPERFEGARALSTAIFFLLEAGQVSRLHRIKSDEIWHFYAGDPLLVTEISPHGELRETALGRDLAAGRTPQLVVPAGRWFGARIDDGGRFALVGCTVAPGFDFADFEFARRETLCARYPDHRGVIEILTPEA